MARAAGSGLEIDISGASGDRVLAREEIERLCALAAAAGGVAAGHIAIAFVSATEIAQLNLAHRGRTGPTDVLSFPVDESGPSAGPRELGDVVICPALTRDLREAIVHGVLHLIGMDHERDEGEMLSLQAELLSWN